MGLFDLFKENKEDDFVRIVRALDDGEEWAQEQIDSMWRNNYPDLFINMSKARVQIYSDAAREGDVKAQYWLGLSLGDLGKKDESLRWLSKLADNGDIDAIKAIANGYTQFGGYGENEEEYLRWMLKAAEAGDAEAQYFVGMEYMGQGKKKEGMHWYCKAAGQKHSAACRNIGQELENDLIMNLLKIEYDKKKHMCEKIEIAYLDAVNYATTRENYSMACNVLANFYVRDIGIDFVLNPERAAFFYYQAHISDNYPQAYEKFDEIRGKYNISVDIQDIEGWKSKLFG